MRELVDIAEALRRAGRPAVLVRAVEVSGFGAGQYDNALLATADGPHAGAVLRGVSDAAVRAAVSDVLADPSGRARLVGVAVSDPDAADAGLSCGGSARLVVEPLEAVPPELWRLVGAAEPVALATVVDRDGPPATLVVGATTTAGSLDDHGAEERIVAAARQLLDDPRAQRSTLDLDPGRALIEEVVPRTRVLCVGSGEVVDALVDLGRALGWLVEPRAEGADAVEAAGLLGPADALVVTTHHPRWGPEALAAGLIGRAFYVGALGSRRTQARRATALAERGLDQTVIAAVHGPIGLDLGGRSPAETALAICAEVLAVRSGRELPGLRDRAGAINS